MAKITEMKYDPKVYSLKAVKRAIHDANISQFATIVVSNEKSITIKIDMENVKECNPELESKLNKMVFDNQIRIDTEIEFKNIRNVIVTQAFFPCENLAEILKDIDL